MPRSCRLLTLTFLICSVAALPLNAAPVPDPAPVPTPDFLAELTAPTSCPVQNVSVVPQTAPRIPEPEARIIYPDCGSCSDMICSGKRTLSACTTSTGQAGTCVGYNIRCAEPGTSKCLCESLN